MSKFSGTSDLYDTIFMHSSFSDEDEAFEDFKKKNAGKLFQSCKIALTSFNVDHEIHKQNEPFLLSKTVSVTEVSDKRCRSGTRKVENIVYHRYGKDYSSLAELNDKAPYYATIEIPFDDVLDLVPYFPYRIALMSSNADSMVIYLANESEIDRLERMALAYGYEPKVAQHYRKQLKEYIINYVRRKTT